MQHFFEDPDSGMIKLEALRLTLAINKKTLDEKLLPNCSEDHEQTATLLYDWWQGIFQKQANPASGTSSGDQVTELSEVSVMDTSCT